MKIATWNVNSIRSRLERLLDWLGRAAPDVVCLQELKVTDEAFPYGPLREAGYFGAVWGQKTYNGVAILARSEPDRVERGMAGDPDDAQARLIWADVAGVRVASVYVPNGQTVGSPKHAYKLDWLARLADHLRDRCDPAAELVLAGDFNVAPDDLDVANPDKWGGSVLCDPQSRQALQRIGRWGLVDLVRRHHPAGGLYSWWDYRMLGFPRNDGLRIDHILATEPLAGRSTSAAVDRQERKGPKPSDHAPVLVEIGR